MTSIQIYDKDADVLNEISIKTGLTVASVIEKMIKEYDGKKTEDECDT